MIFLGLFLGPLNIKPTDFVSEEDVFQVVHSIIADYDHTGQNFPIQKFIFGSGAMQVILDFVFKDSSA